jgi:hypothetical protein
MIHKHEYVLCDVDLQEHAQEHLQLKFEHYVLHGDVSRDHANVIAAFVVWCKAEMQEAISVKRGLEETSYLDRQAAIEEWKKSRIKG